MKRRGVSSRGADWGPCRGSLAPGGRLANPRALRMWGSAIAEPHGRAPQLGCPGAPFRGVISTFLLRVLWFSGLLSKYRSRIDAILKPLRSYLRYGCSGFCFVGFQGRLIIQTW